MTLFPRTIVRFTGRGVTIEAAGSKVTVANHTWSTMVRTSYERAVEIAAPVRGPHLALVRGHVVRRKRRTSEGALFLKVNERLGDAPERGLMEHPPYPKHQPVLPPVQDHAGLVKALSNLLIRSRGSGAGLQRFLPLLATVDFSSQSPERVLGVITDQVKLTAERFVARNVLNTTISRHIPQDTKIAVACRDGGQCTHVDGWIGRCPETTNLHYDHRYVPFRLGGPQEMWNLTLLCAEHNHAKGGEVQW